MTRVDKVAFPPESLLAGRAAGAYFTDAFETPLANPALSPVEIALRTLGATPGWVEGLLRVRNRLVAPVGLKDVGRLTPAPLRLASAYAPGDRLSIFEVRAVSENEVVLGIDDRHLDVHISFLKRRLGGRLTYATCAVVETHNALGRIYMLPVGPFHRLIVWTMMRSIRL